MLKAVAERFDERNPPPPEPLTKPTAAGRPRFNFDTEYCSASDLQGMTFPPLSFIAKPVIAEGVTLFAGREKIGKSWLMLDLAVSVARGHAVAGSWHTSPRDVLYLALEDGRRRIHGRMRKVFGDEATWPDNLGFMCTAPRLGDGLENVIETWAARSHRPGLVVVDTLQLIRPARKDQRYADDTQDMAALKELAERLGISIVLVHHLRKAAMELDPFDTVSGSTGLAAGADSTIILKRHESSQGFELYTRGRDIIEQEFAITFDGDACRWRVLDEAPADAFRSAQGKDVLHALAKLGEAGPKELAARLGIDEDTAKQRLSRMARKGEVTKIGRGRYAPPVTNVTLSPFEYEE